MGWGTSIRVLAVVAAVAALFGGGLWVGYQWAAGRAAIEREQAVSAAVAQREADLQTARSVSAAYQSVAALIRQAGIQSRYEVSHEIERVEYRCLLPDGGRLLLDQAVDRANAAAAGRPIGAVPATGESSPQGPRGTTGVHD